MWGCDYYSSYFESGHFPLFSILPILFFGVAFLSLIAIMVKRILSGNTSIVATGEKDSEDSLRYLKIRFSKGDISEAEYNRMYDILVS